jgi:hypothetical protein
MSSSPKNKTWIFLKRLLYLRIPRAGNMSRCPLGENVKNADWENRGKLYKMKRELKRVKINKNRGK